MKKQFIAFLLCIAMVVSGITPVFAVEEQPQAEQEQTTEATQLTDENSGETLPSEESSEAQEPLSNADNIASGGETEDQPIEETSETMEEASEVIDNSLISEESNQTLSSNRANYSVEYNYTTEVRSGTIRYISQVSPTSTSSAGAHYYYDYWGEPLCIILIALIRPSVSKILFANKRS